METHLLSSRQSKKTRKNSRLTQFFPKTIGFIKAETHCYPSFSWWSARVLGAGLGLSKKLGCDIKATLSSCTEFSKSDKENIRKGIQRIKETQDGFQQLTTSSNKQLFLVGKQLSSLNAMTKRLTELQRLNSQRIETEFDRIKNEKKCLTSCGRRLKQRGRKNYNSVKFFPGY